MCVCVGGGWRVWIDSCQKRALWTPQGSVAVTAPIVSLAGPCREDTCNNPGQVCRLNGAGQAECVCPNCEGRPDEPVCALVGNVVRTYDNECLARRTACELTKQIVMLEQRACEGNGSFCVC